MKTNKQDNDLAPYITTQCYGTLTLNSYLDNKSDTRAQNALQYLPNKRATQQP